MDKGSWLVANLESNGTYILPKLSPEERHSVYVKAIDLAGNFVGDSIIIVVEPIVSPSITYYSRNYDSSVGPLIIEGNSAPNAKIEVILEKNNPIVISTKADQNGFWRIVYSNVLPIGIYSVSARQILDNGAESLFSANVIVRVDSWMGKFLEHLQNVDWYMWVAFFVLIQMMTMVYYQRSFSKFKRLTGKQLDDITGSLQQGLSNLKKNISSDIEGKAIKKEINELQKRVAKSKMKIKKKN
ncbi:MAG: hypothetical protein Q8O88_03025 [bacterium]|nr:hypothetical protein [bacterium]